MIETIVLGVVSYLATNIDDLFLTILFYTEAEDRRDHGRILLGKYLGLGALVLCSLLVSLGLQALVGDYVPLLGLVPLFLGVKALWAVLKRRDGEETAVKRRAKTLALQVALVTIASGADNLGVYTPLFAGFQWWQVAVILVVFALMTLLWCELGKKISRLPVLHRLLERYKDILVPLVYMALGVYILIG